MELKERDPRVRLLRVFCARAGIGTGLFSSPHLIEARERIRIDGKPLSQNLFAKYFFQVYDKLVAGGFGSKPELPPFPAYFRFLTLLSLHVFKCEKVDVGIIEVGIGGLYDSTNVIDLPVVCGHFGLWVMIILPC